MKQIFKYVIYRPMDEVTLFLPMGHEILSAGIDRQDLVCVWVIVDPDAPPEPRKIFVRGTGHPLGDAEGHKFIGTVKDGSFMWHIFAENLPC